MHLKILFFTFRINLLRQRMEGLFILKIIGNIKNPDDVQNRSTTIKEDENSNILVLHKGVRDTR